MIQPLVEDAAFVEDTSAKRPAGRRTARAASNGHVASGDATNGHAANRHAQEIAARLLAVVRSVFMPIDDQAGDMPLAQLRVCTILFEGPRSMSTLSRELSISLSAMTQLADRLERAQLVRRVFEGTDRRVRSLQLTSRARRIIQDREKARVRQLASVLDHLSPEARSQVLSTLETLLSACVATKEQRRLLETKRSGHVRTGRPRKLNLSQA
jgi:DNA-binding MarR family transcriptional regulator